MIGSSKPSCFHCCDYCKLPCKCSSSVREYHRSLIRHVSKYLYSSRTYLLYTGNHLFGSFVICDLAIDRCLCKENIRYYQKDRNLVSPVLRHKYWTAFCLALYTAWTFCPRNDLLSRGIDCYRREDRSRKKIMNDQR